jgi:nucleoside-diphosphate-sugar epimerase
VVTALSISAVTDDAIGAVVNIGHDRSWTLREIVAELVEAVVADGGPRSEVELAPWPAALSKIDIGDYETDSRLAARLLGWRPSVTLANGLRDTVVFYRRHPWYLSST